MERLDLAFVDLPQALFTEGPAQHVIAHAHALAHDVAYQALALFPLLRGLDYAPQAFGAAMKEVAQTTGSADLKARAERQVRLAEKP